MVLKWSTTSGSSFSSSVTLSQSGGTVGSTTVYVRLASALVASGASDTPSGNITCASTGATTKNVSASGTVYNTQAQQQEVIYRSVLIQVLRWQQQVLVLVLVLGV